LGKCVRTALILRFCDVIEPNWRHAFGDFAAFRSPLPDLAFRKDAGFVFAKQRGPMPSSAKQSTASDFLDCFVRSRSSQ
jgi:hypothetical protein